MTNIVHRTSGGTTLASASYVRAIGGEPTRITREDGTYVILGYDGALRLTNEVYYSSGNTPLTTNSYGYDATGNRLKLVQGSQILTNSVTSGYRITQVKDASNGTPGETYDFDDGGRVTNVVRSGATMKLGYNTDDQVSAFTNSTAGTWVTYRHDATGRRTISTNSAGTVRRFLVAATPSGSLPNTLLVANAAGSLQQAYIYLGDRPIQRHDSTGATAYYLEDAMGSFIGLAPSSSPSPANTTRLFYDGFGNARATNGPAPGVPAGVAGDFRFQAGWLEQGSGLYNLHAREYDPRTGRFTSRDPDEGDFKEPETLNPYGFANQNSFVFSDPSGKNSLIEINIVNLIQDSLAVMRQVGINYAKNRIKSSIFDAFINVAAGQLGKLSPEYGALLKALNAKNIYEAAENLERQILGAVCKVPAVQDAMYIEPSIDAKGDAVHNGLSCHEYQGKHLPSSFFKKGNGRPDFVLSSKPPTELGQNDRSAILVGEIKLSANRFYKNYVNPSSPNRKKQLEAICNFAHRHVATDTAVFLTVWKGDKGNYQQLKRMLLDEGLREGTLLILYSATNK